MANSRKDNKGRVLWKGETYRKSDGRYQYTYTDIEGKRQYIYENDLAKLRKKEANLIKNKLDGIDSVKAKTKTLNDMFDKYMSTRHDLTDRTFAGYSYQYDAYVRNSIGKRKLKDIKYSDMLVFYKHLIEDYDLAIGTVERLHRTLHPTFDMAVRDCIIRINPTDKVLVQVKKQTDSSRAKRRALTPTEQRVFLDYLKNHPVYEHWRPIFVFLLGTGLRVGELSALTWKDIDMSNSSINVDHALIYFAGKKNKSKQKKFISTPKTGAGVRLVPMVKEVKEALRDIKKYQQLCGLVSREEIDGYSDFVFLNRFGDVIVQYNLDRALDRIITSYNELKIQESQKHKTEPVLLPHFTCHSLRHTFCARFCENETNIKVIQSVMGHVDIDTTMNVYAEVSEAKKKASMESLADKLNLY